ncbi:MAG TPA: hypothetical protein ENO14_04775, partial [Chromatiales bacterium]|nr:hypothetical protein [Chromatiales bacterium]
MRAVHAITNFPRVYPGEATGANEQDFCARKLKAIRHLDGVCQQHVKATARNLQLAREHRLRPVVLVRNIFDIVPSLTDHFHHESRHFPTGFVPEWFLNADEEKKWMFTIKLHLPWYLNFLLSWQEAEQELPIYWLTYQQLFANPTEVIRDLLCFWNISVPEKSIEYGLQQVAIQNTRMNKGIAGRGQLLSSYHRQELLELVDLTNLPPRLESLIGIDAEDNT